MQATTTLGETQRDQAEGGAAGIAELIAAMEQCWNRHDTKAYSELWAEDAHFVNVLGMRRYNRAELFAEISWLHSGRFAHTQIRTLHHSPRFLAPDLAIVFQEWEMTGDPGQPEYPVKGGTRRGVFTHVAQRTPEGWRLLASQNTDRLPIPDPLRN
jgi:uncharacterized protein (TIGR02246 family)